MSKHRKNISKPLISMIKEQKWSGFSGLFIDGKIITGKIEDLNVEAIKGNIGLGCLPLKKNQHSTVYCDCSGKLALIYDGIVYDFKTPLTREHNIVRSTDADVIAHLLEENYSGDLAFATKHVLSNLEGGFALAATDGKNLIGARDPVGFRTLYYGENDEFYAFATLKKALWKIGIPTVKRIPPGGMVYMNEKNIDVSKFFLEERFGITINIKDTDLAIQKYYVSLDRAVEKMLSDVDKAAVLLSGGVDSCLLAKVLKDKSRIFGIDLFGYTIGFEDSSDIKFSEEFANQIGLPLKKKIVSLEELDKTLPKVVKTVEERDYVQIETSLIPYIAMERVAQDAIKVVFLGQGPDELWGGYPWYPRVLKEWGYAKLHELMWDDLIKGDVETLARENKVARNFGIEVRYPYLDHEVIKTAMSVAPQLKVISDKDNLGKRIHRALARNLGVPAATAERKKTAAQHGSGIHQVLLQIATNNGFNDELVSKLNYSPSNITKENLGSSSRYGYKYVDKDLWTLPKPVQLYFDNLAYTNGLLNKQEREKISLVFQLK